MKYILLIFFVFCSATSFSQLHVTVENIKSDTGTVLIALYNSKKSFNKIREVYREGRAKVKGWTTEYTFDDLPPGVYAISLFHDANDNEALDKNNLGIPSEAYGFSNNAKGNFGPPPFKKAKFTYKGNPLDISIKVN